jgi:hypothetical protein
LNERWTEIASGAARGRRGTVQVHCEGPAYGAPSPDLESFLAQHAGRFLDIIQSLAGYDLSTQQLTLDASLSELGERAALHIHHKFPGYFGS